MNFAFMQALVCTIPLDKVDKALQSMCKNWSTDYGVDQSVESRSDRKEPEDCLIVSREQSKWWAPKLDSNGLQGGGIGVTRNNRPTG